MLIIFILFFGFFLIFSFGYKLSRILLSGSEKLEQISLGFVLGIGIFTFIWFLLNWAGIPYNLISGFILLLSLNMIVFTVDRFFCPTKKRKLIINIIYFKKLNSIEVFLLVIIIFLCISALVQDVYWPIRYWDSLMLYDFRARIFATVGFMQNVITSGYFFGYPLLTSLTHTWVYLLGGTNPSFIYALLYICLLINFFFNLKKLNIGRTTILFLTTMVAVSPRLFDHTQWAYTNLPYSIYYIILGSIYLYFGIKKKDLGAYAISALLIGLSTWTRSVEPFWLSCILVAFVYSLIIRKWLWPFLYTLIILVIMLPWRLFQNSYNQGTANIIGDVVKAAHGAVTGVQFSMIKSVFEFVLTNVLVPYFVYFMLFMVIIIMMLLRKTRDWTFASIIILNLGLIFGGTLSFVRYVSYYQEIPDSLTRMVMFIPPLIIYLLALSLDGFDNKSK